MSFNIDHLIVYIYLLAMLVVGIIAGKGVKTMKDYSIANRSFTNGIMMVTFLATIFGGTSTIGFAESVHEFGAIIIFADLGYILSYIRLLYTSPSPRD